MDGELARRMWDPIKHSLPCAEGTGAEVTEATGVFTTEEWSKQSQKLESDKIAGKPNTDLEAY